jgi:hypothetical protein
MWPVLAAIDGSALSGSVADMDANYRFSRDPQVCPEE